MNIECESALVIGDVAGEFESLRQLIAKSPPAEKIILLGDLNDRGPHSNLVIDWAMSTPNVITLDSNHGDMFVDFYQGIQNYDPRDFLNNGGAHTLISYGLNPNTQTDLNGLIQTTCKLVPSEHIAFLASRPKFVVINNEILCTHAPLNMHYSLNEAALLPNIHQDSLAWNRTPARPREEYKLQVWGHNSFWDEHRTKDGLWGVCIDNSRRGELMSYHYSSNLFTRDVFNFKRWHSQGGHHVP